MAAGVPPHKIHRAFTSGAEACHRARLARGRLVMAYLAMVLFIALFAFGRTYFGWSDPGGYVQLSLVSTFVFGAICGYRAKS
jgi:hypothetical protein